MEKKIKLTMLPSKDILVTVNGSNCLSISGTDRSIKADEIYRMLAYSPDDTYTVDSSNDGDIDAPVLQFFTELIKDVTDRLNNYSETHEVVDLAEEDEQVTSFDSFDFDEDEDLPF